MSDLGNLLVSKSISYGLHACVMFTKKQECQKFSPSIEVPALLKYELRVGLNGPMALLKICSFFVAMCKLCYEIVEILHQNISKRCLKVAQFQKRCLQKLKKLLSSS